ncbi:MAG: ABC transporter ATP-binding protein [Clostridiales bacterium]|nr:ABC transporter ATP-binding protein [Clostridiales bacterium]
MIVFRNVSKVYNMGGEQVRALWNANIHIKQGEFVAVVGPSGSGKSTLMNIVGCLDVASSGQYLLDGIPIDRYSEKQLAIVRNKKIGFIFQNFNLIQTMTAEENVELPLIYQGIGKNERKARVREALQKVDLYERRAHTPGQLSGGQQQRVAIARAMASKPSLFLADEPTGNLDQATGAQIMNMFRELHKQGNTIVLITHDDNVAKQAERSIRIMDGIVTETREDRAGS